MDEITYLSERMDQAHNRLVARESSFYAGKSLTYAVCGIAVGAAFSLMSIVMTLAGKKAAIGSDFFMKYGEMKAELAALEQDSVNQKPRRRVITAPYSSAPKPSGNP